MAKSIRPLGDKVLVERMEAMETTEGGIIIPPLTVKKGDKVLFSKYGGGEISIDGQDLLILEETDILAVLENTI